MNILHTSVLGIALLGLSGNDVLAEGFKFNAPVQLEGSIKQEELNRGRDPWSEYALHASARIPAGPTFYGTGRKIYRYGQDDDQFEAGLYWPFGTDWLANVEGSISPVDIFLPKNSYTVKLQRIFSDTGWLITGGTRATKYPTSSMTQSILAVERYWSDFRGIYTFMPATIEHGGTVQGHDMLLSYYYKGLSFVGFGITFGREMEYDGASNPIFNTRAFRLTGRHWIDPNWAVSFDVSYYEQSPLSSTQTTATTSNALITGYVRQGINIGIRRKF
ncbi:MAG: YaiO family outer membrane beta-barrel protein [Gammaproteobacteria bacterium]|nr:YaiO family outer membrane beta-barrel protein [Gammaproteobacteria bacterium]